MALDFELSHEQQQIADLAHEMLDRFRERQDEFRQRIFVQRSFPDELWQAFAETGFLGALIPQEYGGSGVGLLPLYLAAEAIGSFGFGCALLTVTTMDVACIVRNASEDLKKRVLPEVASGRMKLCFALTEPNAGTNSFRIETRAEREADGRGYRINGQKVYITGADVADRMLVVTRTTSAKECHERKLPKTHGLSMFLVDPRAPGITMQEIHARGIEGFREWTVYFDDVHVCDCDVVGEIDRGGAALFNSLNPERIVATGFAIGNTEYCLKRSVAYAKDRVVFGDRPIGSYQGIAHPLADLKIDLEAARMLAQRAALAFDAGRDQQTVGFWANAAKHKAGDLVVRAVDQAIQTHGCYGFSEEYGIIQLWETARLLRTAPVTREMALNFVAEHVLGLPRTY